MNTRRAHKTWLIISAIVIGSFGPIFTLGTMDATSGPATWTLDFLWAPVDGGQNYDADSTRFLSALTGGFLIGWAVMVLGLRAWVYDLAPEGVRRSLVIGALAWFAFDSFGSVASGAWSNALFNIPVLLMVVGPLWRPALEDRAAAQAEATVEVRG